MGVWKDISKSIFKNIEVKARRLYAFKRIEIDSRRGEIPYGFAMKRIDARFMKELSIQNINVVAGEIRVLRDYHGDPYWKQGQNGKKGVSGGNTIATIVHFS